MSILCGIALLSGSGFMLKKSIDNVNNTSTKKESMIKSAVSYNKIDDTYSGKKFMTLIDNVPNPTGVLDIYQEKSDVETNIEMNSETHKIERVIVNQKRYLDLHVSTDINLNFGLITFVPPNNLRNILTNYHNNITISGSTSTALNDMLKKIYNTSFLLPPNKTYSATFRQFTKSVYAYGKYDGEKYHADIIGFEPNLITNRVFNNEDTMNGICIAFSILGLLSGIGIMGGSL